MYKSVFIAYVDEALHVIQMTTEALPSGLIMSDKFVNNYAGISN